MCVRRLDTRRHAPLGTGRPAVSACVQASSAASVSVSVSAGRARARRRGASPGARARRARARVAPSAVRGPSLRRPGPSCPCQRPPAGCQRPQVPRAVAPTGRPWPAALAARRDRRRPAGPGSSARTRTRTPPGSHSVAAWTARAPNAGGRRQLRSRWSASPAGGTARLTGNRRCTNSTKALDYSGRVGHFTCATIRYEDSRA
jgi:hypothetical protein